jgi:hypothetical protein
MRRLPFTPKDLMPFVELVLAVRLGWGPKEALGEALQTWRRRVLPPQLVGI